MALLNLAFFNFLLVDMESFLLPERQYWRMKWDVILFAVPDILSGVGDFQFTIENHFTSEGVTGYKNISFFSSDDFFNL